MSRHEWALVDVLILPVSAQISNKLDYSRWGLSVHKVPFIDP